ncbi:MAG: DUF86 domain-containing protein, partial [Chloroflexi bacterium]|nr:DUF86 domain-containing protein [Chloroflexota bacterium]
KILAEHKYIDSVQQKSWTQMIGFRNILVHQYIDIDRKIVYDVLQNNLEFIENLRKVFAQFL